MKLSPGFQASWREEGMGLPRPPPASKGLVDPEYCSMIDSIVDLVESVLPPEALSEYSSSEDELLRGHNRNAKLMEENAELKASLGQWMEISRERRLKIQSLHSQLIEAAAPSQEIEAALTAKVTVANHRAKDAESRVGHMEDVLGEVRGKLSAREAEVVDLTSRALASTKRAEDAEARVKEIEASLAEAGRKFAGREAVFVADAEAKDTRLCQALEDTKAMNARLCRALEDTKAEKKRSLALETYSKELKVYSKGLKEQLSALQKDAVAAAQAHQRFKMATEAQAKAAAAQAQAAADTHKRYQAAVETKLKRLKQQAALQAEELEDQLGRKSLRLKQQEVAAHALAGDAKVIADLRSEVVSKEQAIADLKSELDSVRKDMASLQAQNMHMLEEVASSKADAKSQVAAALNSSAASTAPPPTPVPRASLAGFATTPTGASSPAPGRLWAGQKALGKGEAAESSWKEEENMDTVKMRTAQDVGSGEREMTAVKRKGEGACVVEVRGNGAGLAEVEAEGDVRKEHPSSVDGALAQRGLGVTSTSPSEGTDTG
ncbi:unnamed protein product, partial [Discosporangium mesarthrocarpum]